MNDDFEFLKKGNNLASIVARSTVVNSFVGEKVWNEKQNTGCSNYLFIPSSLPPTSPPRRTRSSSSSDDEQKTPGPPPPTGQPALKYHLYYEHAQKTLVITVVEGKVCFQNIA